MDSWKDTEDELYEYKNLGVLKNCIGSFSSNVDDNIEKNLDRRKVNLLVFVKFWRQTYLLSLSFGAELITLNPGLLLNLECRLSWFSRHIFYLPSFAPGLLLLETSGLNSTASEIAITKLLFIGRLITEPNMARNCQKFVQK